MRQPRRVLVIGGSVGGLASALALHDGQREIVIVERDPAPPTIDALDAIEQWERPGVPQFRHAHILLARLHTEIRDHHPKLLDELFAAGLTPSEVDQMMPPTHVGRSTAPEDRDLRHLWGRRATFEYVLRQHVGNLSNVRFIHGTRVEGLVIERAGEGNNAALRVTGVEIATREGGRETLQADVIVDASGSRSKAGEWLAAAGAVIDIERHDSPYAYFCRHYRLRDLNDEPSRLGTGANLDYLWYGLFCAERGNFAIAMACPDEEKALISNLRRAEGFDFTCRNMPVLAAWLKVAEPVSAVHGAGNLANRWTTYGARGGPEVHGYFAVGDSLLQTNPMYGRGCSSAFVQAHALAEALALDADASQQATHYYTRARAQLRSHFDSCVAADRLFLSRASKQRGHELSGAARLLNYLYEEAWMPTLQDSLFVAREMVKAMQMRELSPVGTRLGVVARVIWTWTARRFGRASKSLPDMGPSREVLLQALPTASARESAAEP